MKKYIIAAVFTACLFLCAAMWPQSEMAEETPATIQATVVSAPAPTDENIVAETETTPPTEEEKIEIPQTKPPREGIPEPEPVPEEEPEVTEVWSESEPEPEQTPAPTLTPTPVPSQTVTDSQPGDMVYVPGFGWLKSQGLGEIIYAEDMYENGNKVGSMG